MIPLRHNATLQTLELNSNQIGNVGAAAIGEGLWCVHPDRDLASLLCVWLALVRVCDGWLYLMGVHVDPAVWRVFFAQAQYLLANTFFG